MLKILLLVSEFDNEFNSDLSGYIRDTLCCDEFELFYKDALDGDNGEFNVCIIDRMNLTNYAVHSFVSRKTILYFKKHFVDFSDIQKLVELKSQYLKDNDYISAKDINQLIGLMNIFEQKKVMDALPTDIQIESTSYCNAECIMCRHFYTQNNEADNLSDSILRKIKPVLETSFVVSINGYGEPFLSNSLKEQMELYKRYKCKVSTNTNMSVINEEMIEWINDLFPQIEVSCDGASKNTFEHIRKNLNFDRFRENMKTLREKCPDVLVRFSVVVMRQNIHEMTEIVEMAKDYGVYLISFASVGTDVILRNQKDSMYNYPAAFYRVMNEVKQLGEKYGIIVDTPYIEKTEYTCNLDNQQRELEEIQESLKQDCDINQNEIMKRYQRVKILSSDKEVKDIEGISMGFVGICDWLVQRSYIDLAGNVYPCCTNHKQKLGNLTDDTFIEIWNGERYKKIRDMFYGGLIPYTCLGCSHIIDHKLKFLNLNDTDMSEFVRMSELYKVKREAIEC